MSNAITIERCSGNGARLDAILDNPGKRDVIIADVTTLFDSDEAECEYVNEQLANAAKAEDKLS